MNPSGSNECIRGTYVVYQNPVNRVDNSNPHIQACLGWVAEGKFGQVETQIKMWTEMNLLAERMPVIVNAINDPVKKMKVVEMCIPKLQKAYFDADLNIQEQLSKEATCKKIRDVWRNFATIRGQLSCCFSESKVGKVIANDVKGIAKSESKVSNYEILKEMVEFIEDDAERLEVIETVLFPALRKADAGNRARLNRSSSRYVSPSVKKNQESYSIFFKMCVDLNEKLGKKSFVETEIDMALQMNDFENVERIVGLIDDQSKKLDLVRRLVPRFQELEVEIRENPKSRLFNREKQTIQSLYATFFQMRTSLERELGRASSLQQDVDSRMELCDYESVERMIQLVEEDDTKEALLEQHKPRLKQLYEAILAKKGPSLSSQDKMIKRVYESLLLNHSRNPNIS